MAESCPLISIAEVHSRVAVPKFFIVSSDVMSALKTGECRLFVNGWFISKLVLSC